MHDIGMLTTVFPRFPGDLAGNFVFFLCRELARRGHDVAAVAPHVEGAAVAEVLEGIAVRRFRYFWPASWQRVAYDSGALANLRRSWWPRLQLPLFAAAFWVAARGLARRSRLVHAHWIPAGLVALAARPRGEARRPVVVTVWGSDLALLRIPLLGRRVARLVGGADRVIAVSEAMARELVASGVPAHRVQVVLSAISPLPRPSASREELRGRLGLAPGAALALFLGRLSPVKGPAHLVDAAEIVIKEAPQTRFAFAGDGQLREELEETVRIRGLDKHVHFAGFVPHPQVGAWLAAADLLVLPSLSEGLPHAVLEAMAFSLPVAASAVGGVPEVVQDGVTGHLVPPAVPDALAQAILSLVRDPERRRRLGDAGRRVLEEKQLTWERFADEMSAVYAAVLEAPRATAEDGDPGPGSR